VPCNPRPRGLTRTLPPSPSQWFAPASLADLSALVLAFPDHRLVAANTGTVGVAKYFNGESAHRPVASPSTLISLALIPEKLTPPRLLPAPDVRLSMTH